jgi:hypothetical protein
MSRRFDVLFGMKPAARAATALFLVGGLMGWAPAALANGSLPDGTNPPLSPCSIHVCRPDLQVTYVQQTETFWGIGFNYTNVVKFDVTNTGDAAAGPFSVAVRGLPAERLSPDSVLQTFSVSGLAAGATTRLEYYPLYCPTQTTRIVADTTGAVAEWHEDNNEKTAAFKIESHCIYP